MKNFDNKTVIYTKTTCPYCVNAKALLETKGIVYEEVVIGVGATKESMNQDLVEFAPLNTVPQIVLRGKFIPGGYTGLKAYFDNGGW